jgi:hypothetical protein
MLVRLTPEKGGTRTETVLYSFAGGADESTRQSSRSLDAERPSYLRMRQ